MTTCSKCHRALNDGDADSNGECVLCAPKKASRGLVPGVNVTPKDGTK